MEDEIKSNEKKRKIQGKGIHKKLSAAAEQKDMGKPRGEPSPISLKERRTKRERWLLTRKTWRYMADAGRRLIPEGVHNRQEDVPKIEAYFQEVCQKEAKFLLWRKSSYPGALGMRSHNRRARTRKKGGSCKEKASSADEAEEMKRRSSNVCGSGLYLTPMKTGAGKFDLKKLSEEPKEFNRKTESEDDFFKQLERFLIQGASTSKVLDYQELFDKLERYLHDVQKESMLNHRWDLVPDMAQRELLETLRKHYGKSPNRQQVISNFLTERKLLENLYFNMRKARGFRCSGNSYLPEWKSSLRRSDEEEMTPDEATESEGEVFQKFQVKMIQNPPRIKNDDPIKATKSIQTLSIHHDMLKAIEDKVKKLNQVQIQQQTTSQPQSPALKIQQKDAKSGRRKSSVDHDDVSPSVGDTIKRYLKMARKKSVDTDKADRFKMINYDKNLRNIKPKDETSLPEDENDLQKGCQTQDSWIAALKELHIEDCWVVKEGVKEVITIEEPKTSSLRGSFESLVAPQASQPKPGLLASGQTFLSNLLHGLQHSDKGSISPTAMQKSKSSTSVGRTLVSKKIWRGRSKSQSRIPTAQQCSWTPQLGVSYPSDISQGNCTWSNVAGRQVTLTDTNILHLSDIERRILQKVALAKLQALNIGCHIQLPSEKMGSSIQETKPKRRAHLLKRKAITTSFFDTSRGKDKEGTGGGGGEGGGGGGCGGSGLVFGIPLGQCVENEKVCRNTNSNITLRSKDSTFPDDTELELRRKSHHGSRTSFSSLTDTRTHEESAGSTESLGSSAPGLLDSLSVGSTADITESEPNIPNIVSACVRHIESYGLHTLGIFRVSSSKKRVRQLREEFDSGKEILLDKDCCPHDVATLLKEYFRDLPEPLLCKDLYQAFLHTQKIRNRRLQFEALQHLIQLLPVPNRDTLWFLLNFLSLVAANSNDHNNELGEFVAGNKMDSNNLATLFAPNILHPSVASLSKETLSSQSCEERIDVINVIRSMIDRNKDLFHVSSELLDEVYVHMMDTHPEALDQLLRKKEIMGEEVLDDPDSGVLEELCTGSESSSLPQSPKTPAEVTEGNDKEEKKYYSREQFLHESYENSEHSEKSCRQREPERNRGGTGKKRWRETETDFNQQSVDGRASEDEDHKARNLVIDSSAQSGVIKASLRIPTGSFALNLDDSDIPFIEDSINNFVESSKHHISMGAVRSRGSIYTNRHRSVNSSDSSSQVSIPIGPQPITGSLSLVQGGYDSALGSSVTFSSPPRNAVTSSMSSGSDREYFSSPPSWASSPPLSPDSQTSLENLPEDGKPVKVLLDSPSHDKPSSEEEIPAVKPAGKAQKKSVQAKDGQRKGSGDCEKNKSVTKELYHRVHSFVGIAQTSAIPKSASSSQLSKKPETEQESIDWSRRVTTSISSIGGAVMRSKTADIERMLKIKPDGKTKSEGKRSDGKITKSTADSDPKKNSKRRYAESRHQTRTIPDVREKVTGSGAHSKTQSVWKRREIIASPPKGADDS